VTLAQLFDSPQALPAVPRVVQQLINSFSREDVAIDEIASGLAADPVLSAKTLRLANSAYFHVSRRIGTVDDALRMLGFVMVRNLVVGCGMVGAFKPMAGFDLPQFWRHSLHTACVARWLAPAAGQNTDLAFTLGLVHGLGQLLMHAVQPAVMKPIDARCHPLDGARAAAEFAALGYHYGDASAELALRWKFPAEFAVPLQAHTDPAQARPASPMAALLHVAAWRARVEALRLDEGAIADSLPAKAARSIDLHLAWDAEAATLSVEHADLPAPMPALAELSAGMEAMFQPAGGH